MLKVQIIGNLGQDASIKDFGSNKYIIFSIAHSESYMKDGVKVEKTQWVSCMKYVSGETKLAEYLKKGTKVFIDGNLSAKVFDNKGTPEVSLNCNVNHLELLSAKEASSESAGPANQTVYPTPSTAPSVQTPEVTAQATAQVPTVEELDLPF